MPRVFWGKEEVCVIRFEASRLHFRGLWRPKALSAEQPAGFSRFWEETLSVGLGLVVGVLEISGRFPKPLAESPAGKG